jgi:predicted DNA-binding protein
MKTVSTKLDNKLHNQFIELCNDEGKCQSEFLREMIEDIFEDEEYQQLMTQDLEVEEGKPIITEVEELPRVISHGKILDDYGNVIGTF